MLSCSLILLCSSVTLVLVNFGVWRRWVDKSKGNQRHEIPELKSVETAQQARATTALVEDLL